MGSEWMSGKQGSLSPWSQAKVWALLHVRDSMQLELPYSAIARSVSKIGGGHPTKQAISLMHKLILVDKDWYPGKVTEGAQKRGPKIKFTKGKKRAVALSAMSLKKKGVEPTVAAVVAQCPKAASNPRTGLAFSPPSIARVFRRQCYDVNEDEPWAYTTPCQKTALPPAIIEARCVWARQIAKLNHSEGWYFKNLYLGGPVQHRDPGREAHSLRPTASCQRLFMFDIHVLFFLIVLVACCF